MTDIRVRPPSADTAAPRRTSDNLVTGVSGLTFLVLLVVQNVLKAALSPANDAGPADLDRLAHADAWTVHLLAVTYVIGFPALLLFAAGVARWCASRDERAELWGRLGQSSAVVVAVLFALVNVAQLTLVADRDQLAADPGLQHLVWTLHNAVFTLNLVAVGGALLGLGRAAHLAGLTPRWMGPVAPAGCLLLCLAAVPAVAEIHGSPLLGVGLLGFLSWMLLLAVAGVGLLRRGG
jgi:hypothetical protein